LSSTIGKRQLVEAASAVAIVLSLIFVGVELRQANDIATREVRAQLLAQLSEINRLPIEYPSHAALLIRISSTKEALSAEEYERARSYSQQLTHFWASVGAARDSGFLPDEVYEAYARQVASVFQRYPALAPIVKEYLVELGIQPEFSDFFRRIYEQIEIAEQPGQRAGR
jgi:hypothetical protein